MKQVLKCHEVVYFNRGLLGKVQFINMAGSVREKYVLLERMPHKYHINKIIIAIKKKGLRFEEIILMTETKKIKREVIE